MTPEALCIEGCGRPAKKGYRGWCKPCGDAPLEPGPLPATPDLCVAEGCDEWAVNFDTLCVKHRAFEEWRQSGKKAGTKLRRGRRFGRWKTVERVEDRLQWTTQRYQTVSAIPMWRCLCDCGAEGEVSEAMLLSGGSTGCFGCRKGPSTVIDLTGRRIGRWRVLRRGPNNNAGQAMWWCQCKCGTERLVWGARLRNGESQSCGCLKKEMAREHMKRLWETRPPQPRAEEAKKGQKACSVRGCRKPMVARGWCAMHWARDRRERNRAARQ